MLIWGRSGSGKTQAVADLAEYIRMTTGKKSLVYSIDKGGVGPLLPLVELGVIDLIGQDFNGVDTDPFMFLAKAARGEVRDKAGKWVKADLSQYGLVANESFTGFGDALMNALSEKAAQGVNIGGAAGINFTVNSDGESMKVGGSNMAHYQVSQSRMLDEFWRSQKLPVDYVVWTASASKEDDSTSASKVIGPAGPGKALTAELPRHCDLCFRIDCIPAQNGKPKRHVIYLGTSVDVNAGNAVALGNTRIPAGGKELPQTVEPASIVKVLALLAESEATAKVALEARLKGAASKVQVA